MVEASLKRLRIDLPISTVLGIQQEAKREFLPPGILTELDSEMAVNLPGPA